MLGALVVERTAQMIRVLTERGELLRGIPRGKVIKKTRIYAGDRVEGEKVDKENFAIEKVKERKNLLIRPPIANADRAVCVVAIREPEFDNYLLDCLLLVYDHAGTEPLILFNKIDLLGEEDLKELERLEGIYSRAGYETLRTSSKTGEGVEELKERIRDGISFLAGASGTGKSSILKILTGAELKTGEVSKKLGRGRHTTTGVKLFTIGEDTFIADTPGFSKVSPLEFVKKRDIALYFREFRDHACRYPDCTHTTEPECGVKEAVLQGSLSCERYRSYLRMIGASLEVLREICQ